MSEDPWVDPPKVHTVATMNEDPAQALAKVDPDCRGIGCRFVNVAGTEDSKTAAEFDQFTSP